MVSSFTGEPSTWGDGFDMEVGIPMVKFASTGEIRGDGKEGFMPGWW
jgi:hypothetical protein